MNTKTLVAPARPTLLTTRQVAERLAVSTRSIARFARDGRLPAVKIGPRIVRFRADDLDRLVRNAENGGAQ